MAELTIRVRRYVRTGRLHVYDFDAAVEKARAALDELSPVAELVDIRIGWELVPRRGAFGSERAWFVDIDADLGDQPEEPDRG